MKKVNLNVVAILLVVLSVTSLINGSPLLFLGFLVLASVGAGAARAIRLSDDEKAVGSIRRSNIRLALLGLVFGCISFVGIPSIELFASFAFGFCFGMIGVNMMFDPRND